MGKHEDLPPDVVPYINALPLVWKMELQFGPLAEYVVVRGPRFDIEYF